MPASTDRRLWIALALRVVLPSALCIALFSLAIFVLILPAFEDGLLTRKKEMLRSLTQTVCGLLAGYEERAQAGEFTRTEAQARALRHVRRLRYGDDQKDYFWINDLHPRMIVHPYQPSLDGTDLTDYKDPRGKRLFVEFVDVVRRAGSGYVTYMWQWKDDPTRVVPKLSFVREFEPWGWIVGTGVYLEDVAAEVRSITRKLTLAALVVLGIVALLSSYVVWHSYQAECQRRRAEQERVELQEQLHQAQKMEAVGQLAAGVAHDLNNLLTVVAGSTGPIARVLPADRDATQALEAIQRVVEQAGSLTGSLLTFSQKLPADKKPVDLCAVVDNAARLIRRALPSAVKLVVRTDCQPAPWVLADATQMQQVLLNLALNARDAMPDGGTLRIAVSQGRESAAADGVVAAGKTGGSASPAAAGARVEVSDTGTGMSPEIQSRIFEPFFTTKERGQGTGLGLAVVHGIVNDHGGQIEVRSEVGAGSTFMVTLPCVAPGVRRQERTPPAPPARGRGELLLLAEGDRQARELMVAEFRALGYVTDQVGDGAALLAESRRHGRRVRLFILDADLPKRGTLDCLREIRADGIQVPAIVITGAGRDDFEERLDAATVLLRKPFQMAELGRLVSALLEAEGATET
jgi:signal transduction histidine kinase